MNWMAQGMASAEPVRRPSAQVPMRKIRRAAQVTVRSHAQRIADAAERTPATGHWRDGAARVAKMAVARVAELVVYDWHGTVGLVLAGDVECQVGEPIDRYGRCGEKSRVRAQYERCSAGNTAEHR